MSRVAYIRAWPRDPATGAMGLVTMAGGGSHLPYLIGNTHYRAGIVREPRFGASLGFSETGWTGAAMPQISVIEFAPGDPALLRAYQSLYWKDAPIEVDAGEETAGVGRILTGIIGDATVEGDRLMITVADFGVKLAKPFIQSWFAGTGGMEGDATVEGRVKRRSFGAVLNVEGRILNAANNIYEFGDPAFPLQNFTAVRDMGRAGPTYLVNWQGSVAATLNALIAAPAQQGGAMVAPSIACVKWWTQPAGPLTADIQGENTGGYVETPVSIAARVLAAANGPAIVNQAAANAIRNFPAGLHVADDSETAASALDRLLLPVSLLWRFGTTGQIDVRPWDWSGSAEVVRGRYLGRTKTLAPTKTRRLGYARNHRQHSEGEIAADIIAAGVTYADGTTLEQLKPAEGGANVTGNHSAAAFAGQGALATRSDVIFGSHITSLPAAIAPSNLISGDYLSAGFARYLDNVTVQALRPGEAGANITEGRVASAIAGQGAFATLSNLAYGSPLLSGFGALASLSGLAFGSPQLTGFGSLAGLGNLFFGSPYLLEGSGGAAATLSAFKTALGISSGFTGQGALATISSLGFGSSFLTGFGGLAGRNNIRLGYEGGLVNEAQNQWLTDGSVITGLGTAASIFGQGFGATAAQSLIDNRRIALGQNSAVNSRFTRGTYGWQSGTGTQNGQRFTVTSGVNLSTDFSGKRDVFWARVNTNGAAWNDVGNNYAEGLITRSPWGGASAADMKLFALPVKAGETIACAALVARHRCKAQVFAMILDEGGALVNAPSWIGGRDGGAYNGGDPAEFDRVGGCTDITAPNARFAVFMVRMLPAGHEDPYIFVTEVMLAKVQPGQTELPAYNDGPADPVADQTSVNTASAITGQGALATLSSLANGSSFLTGFGGLSSMSNLFFGSGSLLESNGGPVASLAGFKTSLGQAASISGQGAFATINNLSLDSQLGGSLANRLAPYSGDANYLRASRLAWNEGSTVQDYKPQEPGANITENRTSSGIVGQTAWATFTGSTGRVSRIGEDGFMESGGIFKANVGFLNGWWPDEINSNRTQNNTASAIAGQSAWATFTASTGRVSSLNDLGQINGANVYKPNIGWLGDFWPQEGGANITEGRTASAINGQGPWATTSKSIAQVASPAGNTFPYPRPLTNGQNPYDYGWSYYQNTGTAPTLETYFEQATFSGAVYISRRPNGGSAQDVVYFYDIPARAGVSMALSMNGYGPSFLPRLEAVNAERNQVLQYSVNSVDNGRFVSVLQNTPAGTAFIRVIVGATYPAASSYQDIVWWAIKLEPGTYATPYSEDANRVVGGDMARYSTGVSMNALRPGEANANVTESRTAAAFSGQGTFATLNSLSADSQLSGYMANRLAPYGGDANYLSAARMAWAEGNTVQALKPGEAGANVTELRTASAIAGQGWGATASQARTDNQQVRIGQNRAVNSRFSLGTKAWASQAVQNNNGSAIGVESGVNMDASWWGARDVWYAKINCGGNAWTGGGSTYADVLVQRGRWTQEAGLTTLYYLPVKNGDRIHASALLARHRCITSVFCLIFDRSQMLLVAPNVEGGRSGGGQAGTPANFDRIGFNYDVSHPDAAFACLMVRAQPDGSNTPGDAYVFATEAMLAVIAPGQTSWPDYSDGPEDPRADQTSSNTAAAISGQTAWATFAASTGRVSRIDESGYIQSTGIYSTQGSGGFLSERWPMEGGANATEGRTAAAISGQSAWATYVGLSTTVVEQKTQYLQTDGALEASRVYKSGQDSLANRFPQEAGANVTESRTAGAFAGQGALATRNSLGWTDALFTGRPQYLTDTVDRPGFPGEQSLRSDYITQGGSGVALVNRWPQEAGANVTEARTASGIAGQGSFATQSWINSGNVASFFAYSAFRLEYNITRFDGTTIVTENMVITTQGVSAGFVGQGVGATANNLAQLDPTAQGDINSLKGGKTTFGYGEIKKVVLQPGASINVSGSVGVNSGGGNGNIRAQLSAGPSGGTKAVFASGEIASVAPGEPGLSPISGVFINSSGVAQLFEITLSVLRTPASAGGSINSAQSYFT